MPITASALMFSATATAKSIQSGSSELGHDLAVLG